MPESRTIVLVGHCWPDIHMLKSVVSRAIPGVQIQVANDPATLEKLAVPGSLLLVNRMLDGDYPDHSGIDLIKSMSNRADAPAMMLVSNYEDAQAEATAAGALPGFGKSQLHQQSTTQRLRDAIA